MHRFSSVAQFVICAVWLWTAAGKLADLDRFEAVVREHGVLPASVTSAAGAIPFIEIAIAAGIACFGAKKRLGAACVAVSMAVAAAFAIYLLAVPAPVLAKVGCGCGGPVTPADRPVGHGGLVFRDIAFMCLHLPALIRSGSRAGAPLPDGGVENTFPGACERGGRNPEGLKGSS